MGDWDDLNNPELKKLFRKHLVRGLILLLILIAFIFILALSFEPQIKATSDWLINQFGFLGISVIVFFADLIVSPIPPDVALFFIGKSELHKQWFIYVPFLGLISTLAGVAGWFIGTRLHNLSVVQRYMVYFGADQHRDQIKRFGFWMLILGALTPLPFSITCWLAGIIKIPLKTTVVACLFRIPRFIIYYWAIFYSGQIGSLLRTILTDLPNISQ